MMPQPRGRRARWRAWKAYQAVKQLVDGINRALDQMHRPTQAEVDEFRASLSKVAWSVYAEEPPERP